MKKTLLFFWNCFHCFKQQLVNALWFIRDCFYRRISSPPTVLSIPETIDYVIKTQCSLSRFGDGEAKLIAGKNISFQRNSPEISYKLKEILRSNNPGHLVCLPDVFGERNFMAEDANAHWKKHLARYRRVWYKYLIKNKDYGNAFITRCYMVLKDRSAAEEYFRSIKRLWDDKDIVFIEGEKSRLGIGNDLFDNARSIERILGPSDNAFSQYDNLLNEAKKIDKQKLVLLALGPTATVLAYDLHLAGYHAVDIGHIDIEYEWFLANAPTKQPIKNKYVNEAGAGEGVGALDDEMYQSQIIAEVTG